MVEALAPHAEGRVRFHGLNEVRAVAALAVLISHVELYKQRDGRPSLFGTPLRYFVSHLGEHGVHLFFVLSGFLITYLLLEERQREGDISLRNFYVRRVLRIWPLYFAVVALGFLVVPAIAGWPVFSGETYYLLRSKELVYGTNLLMHLTFLSNFAPRLFPPVVATAQSWSVSVEEQFYLVWPVLLKRFHKWPGLMLLGVVLGKLLLTWVFMRLARQAPAPLGPKLVLIGRVLQELKIELMAFGGLAALGWRRDPERITRWLSHPLAGPALASAIAFQLLLVGHYLSLGVCFALAILYVIHKQFQNRWLDAVGTVSYGLYMFHPTCMFMMFALTHHYLGLNGVAYQLATYVLVLGASLAVSAFSFRFFELPFLTLKARFTTVASGK